MTDESMALLELVEKSAGAGLARGMPAFAAERIMEAEVELATGAVKGARTPVKSEICWIDRRGFSALMRAPGSRWRLRTEPVRVCRRLQLLRGWSDGTEEDSEVIPA